MDESGKPGQREIVYTGSVQGVGFRYTTAKIARRFSVTGHVRNRADGTVELVVEGVPEVIEEFLAEIASHFANNIRDCRSVELASNESFNTFRIIH